MNAHSLLLFLTILIPIIEVACMFSNSCTFPSLSFGALHDLYKSTNGSNWRWKDIKSKTVWNFTVPLSPTNNPCVSLWQGISCSMASSNCDVTILDLANYGLSGSLPLTLHNLTALVSLNLSHNAVKGKVPNSLTSLSHLTTLRLDYNLLTGSLPSSTTSYWSKLQIYTVSNNVLVGSITSSFTSLLALHYVDLSTNKLTGTLPATFNKLQSLSYLNLYNNRIAGSIPYQFEQLYRLEYMDISQNKLAGFLPEYLGHMSSLQTLNLQYNKIVGSIPLSITSLQALTVLKLDKNKLSGKIPDAMDNMTSLQLLYLFNNQLKGTIPSSLCALPNLAVLLLNNNQLTNTIPKCLGNLSKTLDDLSLRYNQLIGPIPDSITELKLLTILDLSSNQLTGYLPVHWEKLTRLGTLYLYDNLLSGTLPPSIGNLTSLYSLLLYSNSFYGTLPSTLRQLRALQGLTISSNAFSGPFPPILPSDWATDFNSFDLYENMFTGKLPRALLDWTNLTTCTCNTNFFSGTFPAGHYPQLIEWSVFQNLFTGSLPATMDSWEAIEIIAGNNNGFSGSFPSQAAGEGSLRFLGYVDLQDNLLTGTFPANAVASWPNLVALVMSSNGFTGELTFPTTLSLPALEVFNVSDNHLRGTLPRVLFEHAPELQTIDLSNNQFTGTITTTFQTIFALQSLLLYANQLTGGVTLLLTSGSQHTLTQVDLSENHFTGDLPDSFFTNWTSLQLLSLAHNCLTVTNFTSAVCSATRLQTLILDGVGGACENRLFPHTSIPTLVSTHSSIEGTVPSCLFAFLPHLQTLHMASNGLQGSLPNDLRSIGVNLTDLSLSHNQLTGTIPYLFQAHPWQSLDLSFNRFSGHLSEVNTTITTTATASYSYAVNRLSGSIPDYFYDVHMPLHLLNGNLFACAWYDGTVPQEDAEAQAYSCGSNAVNSPLYAWCVLVALVSILLMGGYWVYRATARKALLLPASFLPLVSQWWQCYLPPLPPASPAGATTNTQLDHVQRLVNEWKITVQQLRYVVLMLCGWICFGLLPLYVLLTQWYSVYETSYVWVISMAYLTGPPPAYVLFVVLLSTWLGVELWLVGLSTTAMTLQTDQLLTSIITSYPLLASQVFQRGLILFFLNGAVVLTVDMSYVYLTVQGIPNALQFFISLFIAMFKLGWSKYILAQWGDPFLDPVRAMSSRSLQQQAPAAGTPVTAVANDASLSLFVSMRKTVLFSMMAVVNNVVAPCIASAFISPNCFYYTLFPSPTVHPSYSYTQCSFYVYYEDTASISCGEYGNREHVTVYQPPFAYNYLCTSSLLSIFVPIFLYKYCVSTFVFPLVWVMGKVVQKQQQQQRQDVDVGEADAAKTGTSSSQQRWAHRFVQLVMKFIPAVWRLEQGTFVALAEELLVMTTDDESSVAHKEVENEAFNPLRDNDDANRLPHPNGEREGETKRDEALSHDQEELVEPVAVPLSTTLSSIPSSSKSVRKQQTKKKKNLLHRLLKKEQWISGVVSDLAVLITFGTLFPPIAFVVGLHLFVHTGIMQMGLGRVLSWTASLSPSVGQAVANALQPQISHTQELLARAVMRIALLPTLLWAFGLFDILGDAVGWLASLWIWIAFLCIVMGIRLLRLTLPAIATALMKHLQTTTATVEEDTVVGIELQP